MGDVMTLTDAQISEIESDLSTKAPGEEGLVSKAARAKGGVLDALTEAKLRGAKRMLASLDPEDRKLVLGRGDDDGADDDAAKCRKCRTTLKEGAAFCHKCGTSRKEARKADAEPGADGPAPGASRCAKCGADVSMSEAFCTKCGAGAGGSGSDFARHLEKALDSAQAVKPLVTRASRLNPDTLRELQSALQQLAVNITGGHDPIEVGGENIGVNPLEGASREIFDDAKDFDPDELEALLEFIEELRASGLTHSDSMLESLQAVGADKDVAKAAGDAYSEMQRLARAMIAQGVKWADGKPMTLADAMLQVGADHPALYPAYLAGQEAGAFDSQPKRRVQKTVAVKHPYLAMINSRIYKAEAKDPQQVFRGGRGGGEGTPRPVRRLRPDRAELTVLPDTAFSRRSAVGTSVEAGALRRVATGRRCGV